MCNNILHLVSKTEALSVMLKPQGRHLTSDSLLITRNQRFCLTTSPSPSPTPTPTHEKI